MLQRERRTANVEEILVVMEHIAPHTTQIRGLAQAVRSMEERKRAYEAR